MFEIEDREVSKDSRSSPSDHWHKFLVALHDLEPGQSFAIDKIPSNYRNILAALPVVIGRRYVTRKEGSTYRIGRIE